ncbi:MAG: DUF4129 domain-containing protein [Pyrinomonadaceae bacterium]
MSRTITVHVNPGRAAKVVISVVTATLCLLVTASSVQAIPLEDYVKNLQIALTALDKLAQSDGQEVKTQYEKRVADAIENVRKALPTEQSVQFGADVCEVDHRWLHHELDDLEKSRDLERQKLIKHVLERLNAINERVNELINAQRADMSPAQASEKLAGILSRPEYGQKLQESSALVRLLENFVRWLLKLLPKRAPMSAGRANVLSAIAQWLVIGLALAVIAYVIRMFAPRLMRERKKKSSTKLEARIVLGERLEPEESARDLLSEAEALARAGDLRSAIRKAYIALLVELGDRKIISLAHYKTNRDYLWSLGKSPALHSSVLRLTESFERHWYGFASPTQTDWQEFRTGYRSALQQSR